MEQFMQFVEQYWGMALGGGLTVGGLVTFAVVQAKYIIKTKATDGKFVEAIDRADAVVNTYNDAMAKSDEEKARLIAENEYYKASQAVMFKAISYLTAASKLPIEDKLKLQEDFVNLSNTSVSQILKSKTITDKVEPVVNTVIETAVTEAASLLEKYTSKGA